MKMTIRDKIEAVRKVQDYEVEISERLEKIIRNTSDYHCEGIESFMINCCCICAYYWWSCRGECGHEYVNIPIEWLYDGFDYRSAYRNNLEREQAEARRRASEEEERRKKRKEKEEYKNYLKLKKKYEGKEHR